MRIIKVDAIDSTNTFLKTLIKNTPQDDALCVIAKSQTKGKGQHGAKWLSEPGKNLTCSIFHPVTTIDLQRQFYVAIVASLAVLATLRSFKIPDLKIKWPNDIMSGKKKLCGILIENCLNGGNLYGAVLGFGINVNQTQFRELPNASSMKRVLDTEVNVEDVLEKLIANSNQYMKRMEEDQLEALTTAYHKHLFKLNQIATFSTTGGKKFPGIIKGVTHNGALLVQSDDESVRSYQTKEIALHY